MTKRVDDPDDGYDEGTNPGNGWRAPEPEAPAPGKRWVLVAVFEQAARAKRQGQKKDDRWTRAAARLRAAIRKLPRGERRRWALRNLNAALWCARKAEGGD